MRFAYIDSQGNEVEIPSEDALRLRIELGAIVADTSFYDSAADRWGPAGDHDLFRRLKRDVSSDERGPSGSLARPERTAPVAAPPVAPSVAPPVPPMASLAPTGTVGPGAEIPAPVEFLAAAAESGGAEVEETADEVFDFGDFGALDLEAAVPVQARSSAPTPDNPMRAYAQEPVPVEAAPADPWTVPGREPWPPAPDGAGPPPPAGLDAAGFGDEPAPEGVPAPSAAAPHPFEADEDMPDWLRNDPEFGEGAPQEAPAFPTRDQVRERYEADHGGSPPAPERPSRKGPSRPPRLPSRSRWPRVVAGVVAIGLVGGGGAWFFLSGDRDASASEVVVEIPPIAPSLEPVFRTASTAAVATLVERLAVLPPRESLSESPHDAWLGGRYMANASQFPDVRLYWESVGRYAQIMQAREQEVFAEALSSALDTIPLPGNDRAAVEARALAGFTAAAPDRNAVYGQLRSVVDASLMLHVFLEQNEADIDYDPVDAGLSRDPVLEAVPITESLGKEMWNRVAEITSALDHLGFLDKVTTERMLDVFHTKLAQVPVR